MSNLQEQAEQFKRRHLYYWDAIMDIARHNKSATKEFDELLYHFIENCYKAIDPKIQEEKNRIDAGENRGRAYLQGLLMAKSLIRRHFAWLEK